MNKNKGFSLIELMVVIGLIGVLASLGVASYSSNVLKTRRSEAFTQLLRVQSSYETYYSQNNTYPASNALPPAAAIPSTTNYSYTSITTSSGYTLTATALAAQLSDKEGATTCSPLTLDNLGNKTPAVCWPS
jgi:type IV pilus assembly protein PilE